MIKSGSIYGLLKHDYFVYLMQKERNEVLCFTNGAK